MIGTVGVADSSLSYSGTRGRYFSSTAMIVSSVVAVILAGVRPRFVAMMVKLFSMLRDGSTVINSQGLSEWMKDCAFSNAA